MATITLNAEVYNSARKYAEAQHISVEDLIVQLIHKVLPHKEEKQGSMFQMKSFNQLNSELQTIIGFASKANLPVEDLNGSTAREEYIYQKQGL